MLTYLMNTGTQTCFDEVCFDLHDAYLVESYKFDLSGTVNIDGNVTICWGTWDGSKVGDVWESEATFRDPYEDSRRTRLDSDPPTSALSFSKTVIVPNKDTLYYYRVKYWLGTYGAYGAELTEKTVWSKVKTVKTLPDIATVVEDVGWSSAFGNFIRVRFDNVPAGKPMFYIVWGETDEGSSPAAFLSGAEDFSVDLDDWDETVLLQSSSLLFPENGSVSRTLTGLSQNSDYYIRCVQLGSPSTEGVTGWAWSPTLVGTTSSAAGAQAAAGAAAGAATALAGGTMAQVGAAAAAAVIAAGGTPFSVAVGTAAGLAVTAAGGSAAEIAAAIYAATTTPNAIFSDRISEWFADEAAATAAYGHISNWDTSTVTNMTSAFQGRASFNEDISAWNVSNVTDMNYMFYGATAFNQNIGSWKTSAVTDMSYMFTATAFNQNIGSWKTSAVTDMQAMFQDASSFDQDISSWVITAVTNYANLDANTSTSWTTAEKPAFDPCIRCVPVITSNSGGATTAISIAENITAVTTVVATEGPIYSKSGTDAALFTLDSSTGVLTFVSAPDFETPGDDGTDNDYEVTVTATNAAGADSQAITVTVTDVASPEIFITSNSVFATAVDSWFSNETSATTTYGHISNWDVSAVTDMKDMIRTQGGGYSTYGFNENLSGWDVSNVTTMENMFWGTSAFEGLGISGWDVSNVTNMRLMFHTTGLNQDISGWDTGKVTDMSYMFWGWDNNSPIVFQDVSSVTTMQSMFSGTTSFNQDISGWNTGNVTNMAQMFMGAEAFDQDISNWNVTAVTNHPYPGPAPGELPTQFDAGATLGSWITVEKPTFSPTALTSNTGFNTAIALWFSDEALCRTTYGPPSAWDVSAVTSMNEAFSYTASGVGQTFNEDIGNWDVSNVTDMAYMFSDAAAFNADISSWNVSSVTDMNTMFYGNTAFDQDIGSWDVSNVTQIYGMFFNATSFNKDIGSWNTSAVGDMSLMFKNASSFVQDISSWNVSAVTSHVDFAANTSVSWTSGMKPTF